MNFLFLFGLPNDGRCVAIIDKKGGMRTKITGAANIKKFIRLPGVQHEFFMSGTQKSQYFKLNFIPDVIVNEISDADTHSNALNLASAFCQNQNKPVINHPDAIRNTRRDHIAQRLSHIKGLIIPLTIRFQAQKPNDVIDAINKAKLQYPVIFRKAGDHGGISITLLENEADIETKMHAYALDNSFFYATQFVDYQSNDGLYRKYRIAVVSGQPFLRHLIISNHWLIHSSSRQFMQNKTNLQLEEEQTLRTFSTTIAPLISPTISAISQILALDYYGIDCTINDHGQILAFEINSNMNILLNNQPSPNIWEAPIQHILTHLHQHVINQCSKEHPYDKL
jgi:glutathione synthase/RimK-type ligase-like ATP-grasp enzyme